jgi:16S rRNA G966 N2-methylase RsmD
MRPTSDRLRETLFNILGPSVEDSIFVDAYAGTGAVGIEAASRGAAVVFFIENHRFAVSLIRLNLQSLGLLEEGKRHVRLEIAKPGAAPQRLKVGEIPTPQATRVEVIALDAARAFPLLHGRRVLADYVFLDPPYGAEMEYLRSLTFFSTGALLAPAGLLLVESAGELPAQLGSLESIRTVKQGDSRLTFYRLARAA